MDRPSHDDAKTCLHCHRKSAKGRRGLCWTCSSDPEIREQYAPIGKFGEAGAKGGRIRAGTETAAATLSEAVQQPAIEGEPACPRCHGPISVAERLAYNGRCETCFATRAQEQRLPGSMGIGQDKPKYYSNKQHKGDSDTDGAKRMVIPWLDRQGGATCTDAVTT